jgi:hypothetical protein
MLTTTTIAQRLTNLIVNPLIALIFAAGLLVFFWGVIEFLLAINADGHSSKEDGKMHMLWGLIGMFVMVAAYALFNFLVANICGSLSSCYSGANL